MSGFAEKKLSDNLKTSKYGGTNSLIFYFLNIIGEVLKMQSAFHSIK